jgi:hypothetical protein
MIAGKAYKATEPLCKGARLTAGGCILTYLDDTSYKITWGDGQDGDVWTWTDPTDPTITLKKQLEMEGYIRVLEFKDYYEAI